MKTSELLNAVKKLKKVVPRTSTLPILDYLLNNHGTLLSSNLSFTHIVHIGFDGKFLIDTNRLSGILSKLPKDSEVEISGNDLTTTVQIVGGGKFEFAAAKVEDFPALVKVDKLIGSLPESDVVLMKRALRFTADDSLRPVMAAVYVGKHIVGSDAHSLAYYAHKEALAYPVIIDREAVKLIPEASYKVHGDADKKWIKLSNEEEIIYIRIVDGNYPTYMAVIPQDSKIVYEVEKKKLKETIELAAIAANQSSGLIRFLFNDSELIIASQDIDFASSFSGTIPAKHLSDEKEAIEVGMNDSFILNILADCGDMVQFRFKDPSRAILIDSDKLLMPMMINT